MSEVGVIRLEDIPPDTGEFYPCEEPSESGVLGALMFGTTSRHVPATWLPAAFDKWGVRYVKVAGWEDRGRPMSSGYFDPNASLTHHTGSTSSASNPAPSLRTVIEGRSDLSGPLCQVSTDFNGLTYIVAAGRANHAGTAKATMGNPAGDGNAMYVGNEVQTNGTQKMPQVQYDAVVLVAAAIADHFNQTSASKVGLHATTSLSGKWDLGAGTGQSGVPYSITKFRADVAARLAAGPPTQEDDMADITEANVRDIFTKYAIMKDVRAADPETVPRVAPSALIEYAADNVRDVEMKVDALGKKIDALAASITAGGLSSEEAKAIFREEVAKKIDAIFAP
jgi:outer membrane murein-binding lipoprotein Lpp